MTALPALFPEKLQAATGLLRELSRRWPGETVHIQKSRPLWQEAITHISPEWADTLGGTVSWLDHASVMLIRASAGRYVDVNLSAYKELATELEAIIAGESIVKQKGLKPKTRGGAELLPEEKIAELFDKKEGLNRVSAPRIKLLREAIDFSETVMQLSALCLEVVPHLTERCASEISAAEIGTDTGLFEDQNRLRNTRKTERAMQSLNIASQRLRAEFTPEKSVITDELEKSIRAEEDYHARIENLIGVAKNKIAADKLGSGERAYTQELNRLAAHQAVVSSAKQLAVVQTPARIPAFFSIFTRAKDAAPGKLLDETQTALRLMVKNIESDNMFWIVVAKAMEDPNLRPKTPIPGTYARFRTKKTLTVIDLISKRLYVDRNPDGKYELVNALIARHPDRLEMSGFNWENLRKAALLAARSSTLDTMIETWKLLDVACRFAPLENPSELITIANSNYFAKTQAWPEEKTNQLLEITASVMNAHVSIEHYQDYLKKSEVSSSLLPLTPHLEGEVSGFIMYRVLLGSMRKNITPFDEDIQIMERLPSKWHELLARQIIEHSMPEWAKALSVMEGVKALLSSPPSADTQWAFALKDFTRLFLIDKGDVPRDLLAHVIETNNGRVLEYIQKVYQDRTLSPAKTSMVADRDRVMFKALMDQGISDNVHPDVANKKPSAEYWCRVFSEHVNTDFDIRTLKSQETLTGWDELENHWEDYRAIEFGGTNYAKSSMSPLMRACQHGNTEWVKALIDAGADCARDKPQLVYELSKHAFTRAIEVEHRKLSENQSLPADALRLLTEKQQSACIREAVYAMNETGLWDIRSAAMGAFDIEMTAVALYKDACNLPGKSPSLRQKAIKMMVKNMTTNQFIETLSYLGDNAYGFYADGDQVKTALLQYGAIVGITSSKKLEKALDTAKDIMQRRQCAKIDKNMNADFIKALSASNLRRTSRI